MQTATNIEPQGRTFHVPSSIEQLRENGPLEDSDDGVVPYRSAHLVGALSEKVIVAGHSVQETPRAILEIRRILHEDIAQIDQRGEVCGEARIAKRWRRGQLSFAAARTWARG
ncbi:putative DNA-binding protein with PD1-like motif [Paraburkholderia sp. MM6662-R1]